MYKIEKNKYNLKVNDIFVVGKRANNAKRSFLFVSKLLGKHISVNPEVVKSTGFLLSSLKYGFDNQEYIDCITKGTEPSYETRAKDDNILVIGFCETATGLGMSVASAIDGCTYQTTTREPIEGMHNILSFEEEHSHATTHNMVSDFVNLKDYEKAILVDDEITTGNSLLNLMGEISKLSNIKEYNVMTILDWRNATQIEKFAEFEKEHNVKINVYSLISGHLNEVETTIYKNDTEKVIEDTVDVTNLEIMPRRKVMANGSSSLYLQDSGRFGVISAKIQEIEQYAKIVASEVVKGLKETDKRVLVLGHGENMYIPSRIASYVQKEGKEVLFRTTSLSPIYCDGEIIKDEKVFYDRDSKYHFYNVSEAESYDKVIMLTETPLNVKLSDNIQIYNI